MLRITDREFQAVNFDSDLLDLEDGRFILVSRDEMYGRLHDGIQCHIHIK